MAAGTRQPRRKRATEEVFHDHLRRRVAGDTNGDLRTNYATDVVLIDRYEVRHGHDGVRDAARSLAAELPGAEFEFVTTHVAGEFAYLEWKAQAGRNGRAVHYGADTFVVRDGLIRAQTLYYRVAPAPADKPG